jgi:hypothetical protein
VASTNKSSLTPLIRGVLAAAGFLITVAAFYPGIVSIDSIAQYEQGLAGRFNDHHPPLMAWLWSLLGHITRGPSTMLVLHAALVWGGLWLFAEGAARRGLRHAWLLVLAGFLPPIIGIEGMIWKDVGMAAALLFATGLLYRASVHGARAGGWVAAIAIAILFYATAVRANAPAATGPIAVYWAACVFPQVRARTAIRVGIGVLALLLLVQWGIDTRVLHARRMHASQVIETFDLAAIQCAGGDATIPPAFVRDGVHAKALCDAFDPRLVDLLYFDSGSPLQMSTDHSALRALGRAWRQAVVASPGLYIAHRWRAFTSLLGFGVPDAPRLLWSPYSVPNGYGITFTPNAVTGAIGVTVAFAHALGLYNGAAWLLLAGAVVLLLWRQRRQRARCDSAAAAALAVSAICYTLAYFFIAIAPDYRYIYWTIIATTIAALLALLGQLTPVRAVSR